MFEKRFLYIFLACSVLLIGCSKCTEEKAVSVNTGESSIVAEKDASDEATNSISENQSDDPGQEITPVASNPYFFRIVIVSPVVLIFGAVISNEIAVFFTHDIVNTV